MNGKMDWTTIKRVDALEAELNAQERRLRRLENLLEARSAERSPEERVTDTGKVPDSHTSFVEDSGPHARGPGEEGPGRRKEFNLPGWLIGLRSWEWWLNKVGIGLLLFGVAFLFKFSVDQGWLTPLVRVGIGLSIGVVLIGIGLRVYGERRAFSQVMLGGGIGTFYTTGFAAFQLYAMVSYPVAISFMVAVTLLAFALSLRQNGGSLALIGGAGGFGTPFVLYMESGSLTGLVLYACLLLSGVCAIYLYKGWCSLLLFSTVAVWMTFVAGYDNFVVFGSGGTFQGRVSLQFGVLFAWLALCAVSVARELLCGGRPGRWGFSVRGWMARPFAGGEHALGSGAVAHLLSFTSPIIVLAFTSEIWNLQKVSLGWVALGGAALYAPAAVALWRIERGGRLSYTHALVALMLATLSLVLVLEGDALFIALAAEAVLLHTLSHRLPDRILSALGHGLFLAVGVWLSGRLVFGAIESTFFSTEDAAFFDVGTWMDFTVIALAFWVSGFVAPAWMKRAYGIAVHVALLGWLWRELAVLPDSGAYISLAWGIYAVGLLVVGLRVDRAGFTRLGLVTLFVVVGKLFLVDLTWVGAVWRILLFLGFGGVFLALSYYLQSLWKPGKITRATGGGA